MNNDPIFDGSLLEFITSFDPMKIDISYQDQKIPYIKLAKVLIDLPAEKFSVTPALRTTYLFVPEADLNKVKKIFALYSELIARIVALSELVGSIQQAQQFHSVINIASIYDEELYCIRKDLAAEIDYANSVDQINSLMFTSTIMAEAELDFIKETIEDSSWVRLPFYSDLMSLHSKITADAKSIIENNWLVKLLEPFRADQFSQAHSFTFTSRYVQ